jgi:glycosyltransferase involved in cell wall biosynthesis
MKHICIIDPVLTRYNMPVFAELSSYCNVDWIFSPAIAKSGFGDFPRTKTPSLRYIEIPTLRPFGDKIGMFQLGILKHILRERPAAVRIFANPRYLSFWMTLVVAKFCGVPCHAHGVGLFKKGRIGFLRRFMMNLMLRLVTSYIAYAPLVRDSFAVNGFSLDKVSLAHNSLLNPFPIPPEEKTGHERDVLFIGRLRPRSGLKLLLKVLRSLHQDGGFPLNLHVVGMGEEAEMLRREAAGCSWVTWHGDVNDERVAAISRSCLLGCYPGNAGLSVVHMMSLSLPVVIHDDLASHEGPEPSYVRDGISGILYDHKDPEASLSQVLRLVAQDPSRVVGMQRAAFEAYQALVNPSYAERLWSILGQEGPAPDETLSVARREELHSDR